MLLKALFDDETKYKQCHKGFQEAPDHPKIQ
jgi:hypothetical protein